MSVALPLLPTITISPSPLLCSVTFVIPKMSPDIAKCSLCVCVCVCSQSYLTFVIPWTVACQAPLSMEFSSQEYWSGSPFPTSGDLPDTGSSLCLFISSVDGQIHHQLQHLGSRICNSLSVCLSVRVSVCLHWTISDVFSASFKVAFPSIFSSSLLHSGTT